MTLHGQEWKATSAKHQAPFRPLADQRDLTCGEWPVQGPLQARFGTIPGLFAHGLPVGGHEQGALILLRGDECLHCKRRSKTCPTSLTPANGHETRSWDTAPTPVPS